MKWLPRQHFCGMPRLSTTCSGSLAPPRALQEPPTGRRTVGHDKNAERQLSDSSRRGTGLRLCRTRNRPSFDAPAVINRCKQKNARRLQSVWLIFATCVERAAWKRSAPSQMNRSESVPVSLAFDPHACWCLTRGCCAASCKGPYLHTEIKQQRRGFNDFCEDRVASVLADFVEEKGPVGPPSRVRSSPAFEASRRFQKSRRLRDGEGAVRFAAVSDRPPARLWRLAVTPVSSDTY